MQWIGRNVRTRLLWMDENRAARIGIQLLALGTVPPLLVLGMEWLQRGSFAAALVWMTGNWSIALLNVFIQALVFLLLYGLIGSLIPAIGAAAAVVSGAAMINMLKLKMIGQPFFPWDVLLRKESLNIAPMVTGPAAMLRIVLLSAVIIGVFLLRLVLPRIGLRLVSRLSLGLAAIFVLYSFGTRWDWAENLIRSAGVSEISWDQRSNYASNGVTLAFAMNVKNMVVPKPSGYGEQSIATLAQGLSELELQQMRQAYRSDPLNGRKPNVIFIMNEAFWDPTLLPQVVFPEDPLPTFHRLQNEAISGYLLSPQFGGGTSNVEYEVLTGQSVSLLPAGTVPYQQYVRKPVPSLASYFKTQGYRSVAIHSYLGWFWNRQTVYKHFGFDSFKSEEQFVDPEYSGWYIADAEVSRSLASAVIESEEPLFIYAVTMQNHGPYDDMRYGENTVHAEGPLTPDAKRQLETYAQGVRDADNSLQMLIDQFEPIDEPILIVFFGDHLPMLGYDYDVYKQGGFIQTGDASKWSLEEQLRMHSVPFVMWANFAMEPQNVPPVLSNSFLGAFVLNSLKMEKPATFAFAGGLSARLPGLLSNLVVDASGQLYSSVPDSEKAAVEQYRELQYDQLFGQQYLEKFYAIGSDAFVDESAAALN
ncbi:LTA synthase family protein [Paenibacillus koleovorans]|uniref:LTA synthase family protein n=1 Tax=Paenibacillus koleovorans TaxID=121608 RepID=UPI000FD73E43|nr:alkaline phosphatase family protein [Paenibacillus koleovorans]